jgi:hypothetical protein
VSSSDGASAARLAALRLVRDGHDLHYLDPRDDADLALLDGDRLYAAGLEKLAAEGDLEAIRALADLISDCARAAAEERPGAASEAWGATALRLGVTGFTPS